MRDREVTQRGSTIPNTGYDERSIKVGQKGVCEFSEKGSWFGLDE